MTWWSATLLVGYMLAALAVACLGAFGFAATRQDRDARIRQFHNERPGSRYYNLYAAPYFWRAVRYVTAAAVFWPAAVPLYLAWKRGTFINDALVARSSPPISEET